MLIYFSFILFYFMPFKPVFSVLKTPLINFKCYHIPSCCSSKYHSHVHIFCIPHISNIIFLLIMFYFVWFYLWYFLYFLIYICSATPGWKSSGNGSSTAACFKRISRTRIDALVQIIIMPMRMMMMKIIRTTTVMMMTIDNRLSPFVDKVCVKTFRANCY